MLQSEYNIRLLIYLLVSFGTVWVAHTLIKSDYSEKSWVSKHFKTYKILTMCVCALIVIALIVYMFCGFAYKENVIKDLTVTEIHQSNSIGGILEQYTLFLQKPDGEIIRAKTDITSSFAFKNKVSKIDVGDVVTINYVPRVEVFYNIDTE